MLILFVKLNSQNQNESEAFSAGANTLALSSEITLIDHYMFLAMVSADSHNQFIAI